MNLNKHLKQIIKNGALKCVNVYEHYATTLNNISIEMGLKTQVASLSNCAVADSLMYTIKQIAYASPEPNHETICWYLEDAIEDLVSGMDAAEVLWKYDIILYNLKGK